VKQENTQGGDMRIYGDCKQLMSEIFRDVLEMGIRVHPHSMQNKVVVGDDNFSTMEITNYDYCLLSLKEEDFLFLFDPTCREWIQHEILERVGPIPVNPGEAYKIRPHVWDQFLVDGKFDYTYSERIAGKGTFHKIANEIRVNPDSRQLLMAIWDREDIKSIGGKKRIPCSIYYQFMVREGQLNIIYNQRSADVVTHFGNDVWLAHAMMRSMVVAVNSFPEYKEVPLREGYLYHNIGSLHVYKRDLDKLKACVSDLNLL